MVRGSPAGFLTASPLCLLHLEQHGIKLYKWTANSGYFSFGSICSIVSGSDNVQYGHLLL